MRVFRGQTASISLPISALLWGRGGTAAASSVHVPGCGLRCLPSCSPVNVLRQVSLNPLLTEGSLHLCDLFFQGVFESQEEKGINGAAISVVLNPLPLFLTCWEDLASGVSTWRLKLNVPMVKRLQSLCQPSEVSAPLVVPASGNSTNTHPLVRQWTELPAIPSFPIFMSTWLCLLCLYLKSVHIPTLSASA